MIKIEDIGLLEFGHTIDMVGVIYRGDGEDLLLYFPGESPANPSTPHAAQPLVAGVHVEVDDWTALLRQTDLLEVEILEKAADGKITKAIVRKSARQIEQGVSWKVYRRDNFACRYCGRNDCPLTVDHLVTWETGGPSIEANLVSSCRKCNKIRGKESYDSWLQHPHYLKMSRNLTPEIRAANEALMGTLKDIPLRVNRKSR